MKTSKICPVCLKLFSTEKNAVKFCSTQCSDEYKKLSKRKKCVCAWCNKTFYTMRKRTYCTENCRMYANARISETVIKKPPKPKVSLAEVARLANECGITYGKYVQQYGL